MSKIKITLNGEKFFLEAGRSIAELIQKLDLDISKIAIEKNLEIINHSDFSRTTIMEDDEIEIVSFIGGG